MKPRVLIPLALGTNRDADLGTAFELAGADPILVPLSELRAGKTRMNDFEILAIPGGFSYGDALGAGRLFGLDLMGWFGDQLHEAVAAGKPIIGICNGFQALVRAGLLPGPGHRAVLGSNRSSRFECRWVTLEPGSGPPKDQVPGRCLWTESLRGPLRCPVAHGEGRFVSDDLDALVQTGQIALRYVRVGTSTGGIIEEIPPGPDSYPHNPNGSVGNVAGVCDSTGQVLGLMPHPENHVFARQDPQRGRSSGGSCLPLFEAGVVAVGGKARMKIM